MNRTRSFQRHQRFRVIARKKRIIRDQRDYWHYRHEGELAKGKIHCSCPLCRHKSYDSPKISDRRRRESMDSQERDL